LEETLSLGGAKKQNGVALSSAEVEYGGMVKDICELIWINKLITELGFNLEHEIKLFCDNKAAIDIFHNPVQHEQNI
jgi:hypothetical protein